MSKFKNCKCNKWNRDDNDFMLTTHHPRCPAFDPGWELKSIEDQCKHFMGIIQDLRDKIRDMENIIESTE